MDSHDWGGSASRREGRTESVGGGREYFEILAAAVTAALFLAKVIPLFVFMALTVVFWAGYAAFNFYFRGFGVTCHRWGFRIDNIQQAFIGPTAFSAFALALLIILCMATDRKVFVTGNLIICIVLYPFWGTIQQFLVQSMWMGNLSFIITKSVQSTVLHQAIETLSWELVTESSMSDLPLDAKNTDLDDETLENSHGRIKTAVIRWCVLALVVLASAGMFGLVHFPHRWLMLATFVLGLPWSLFFLKHRNLFPLGFYHGVVGSCFYFWWLQEDPLGG